MDIFWIYGYKTRENFYKSQRCSVLLKVISKGKGESISYNASGKRSPLQLHCRARPKPTSQKGWSKRLRDHNCPCTKGKANASD